MNCLTSSWDNIYIYSEILQIFKNAKKYDAPPPVMKKTHTFE